MKKSFEEEGFDLFKLYDPKGGEAYEEDHEEEWKEAGQEGRRKEAERSEADRGGKESLGNHSSEDEGKTGNKII